MAKIYVEFCDVVRAVPTVWTYNQFVDADLLPTGQVSADLKDDTNTVTGVSLHIDTAFSTSGGGGSFATADAGEFDEVVLDSALRSANSSASTLRIAGLPSGASYTLQLAGHASDPDRDTLYTVEGTTGEYLIGTAGAPTAPVSFSGTVDPDGEIIIDVEKTATGEFYGYLNGFILEYTTGPTGLTIDSTDSTMQRGTNFELVCSGATTAPTLLNTTLVSGNDTLTPSSVTGSDPYTLTFAAGDLTKQVDATGYDWTLTIDAETATTGNIPLVIQADYTKVDLVNPVTTNASLLYGATGATPVTGDDLEYDVTSVLNSGVTFGVTADAVWTITEASEGDWTTAITVSRRVVQADGTIGTEAVMTFDPRVGAPATAGSIPYAMRQMASRLSFHSYLIQESRGRWEQDQLNAAIVALGGSAMTPPVGAPDAAVGYTGTQTYLEFYKRLQRALVYPTPIDVVPAVQAALLARGWTL